MDDMNKGSGYYCSNGELLFIIYYEYTMYEDYDEIEDEDNGLEMHSFVTTSAIDEAAGIVKFKQHFTMNVDRCCPFDTVDFEITEAKRVMI